eukprot:scaffold87561_cov30-Tisochrysis_lutea.AAC.1
MYSCEPRGAEAREADESGGRGGSGGGGGRGGRAREGKGGEEKDGRKGLEEPERAREGWDVPAARAQPLPVVPWSSASRATAECQEESRPPRATGCCSTPLFRNNSTETTLLYSTLRVLSLMYSRVEYNTLEWQSRVSTQYSTLEYS